jgi:GTP-binding protein
MFKIAIVGRPNVGKSTLFNKLAGRVLAIVNNRSGVTRDRKVAIGYLGDITFEIIDTAGWEDNLSPEKLEFKMVEQTELAISEADLCLFLVDSRVGITDTDMLFANKLRKFKDKVLLVANKCENITDSSHYFGSEYYKLGLGEPIGISAEHKDGFLSLYEAIAPFHCKFKEETKEIEKDDENDDNRPIQLAIVGRANSGKSTLINKLLGEERVITSDIAGTTRDSIVIDWEYEGQKIRLVDTAGLRKKRNISEELEQLSASESLKSIRFAQVVIMMIDATRPFDTQELSIISILVNEGRGIVFALNKCDLITNKKELTESIFNSLKNVAPEVKGCPVIPISALKMENIDKLMSAVFNVFKAWNTYISTSKLNNWIKTIEMENPPPLFRGNVTKLKYITQAKKRPPTFVLFTNSPERLEKTQYNRFIVNALRRDFNLENTIVRLLLRKSDNPFENVKKRYKRTSDTKKPGSFKKK